MVHCTREFLRTPQGSLIVCGAFFSLEVPSGYVKIAMENYSEFTHWKWWFSIAMLNYQRVSLFKKLTKAGRFCMLTLSITAISRFIKGLISQHLNFKEPYLIFLRGIRPPNFSCSTSIFLQPTSASYTNQQPSPAWCQFRQGKRASALWPLGASSFRWRKAQAAAAFSFSANSSRASWEKAPWSEGKRSRVGVYMEFTIWLFDMAMENPL